ncbi:hypothetical protein [Sessilibacter corallicola]|uniref:hypothetical protein n=1 Tax=Sessilibacter corallicola TaxID=2904075 RepID=UPI001E416485|nr:hypothetical protein [Sessilibacter corallicola]MCE2029307.1 hypothetical protein [Sessilibacter corallicola]
MWGSIKKYRVEWALIALAYLTMIIPGYFKPDIVLEPIEVWYQRSGALVVMLAIMVEFRLSWESHFNQYFSRPNDGDFSKMVEIWNEEGRPLSIIHVFVNILLVWGTITWAYGDLIHPLIF